MKKQIGLPMVAVLLIAMAVPVSAGQWTVQSFTWTPVMQYYDANFQGDLIGSGFSTYGTNPVGRLSGASGNPNYSQERYRSILACGVPDNGIPNNATIQSATLSVTFTGFPYNVNQTVKLVDINPGTSWSRSATELWNDAQAGSTYKTGIPGNVSTQSQYTFVRSNPSDVPFLDGIQSSLSSDYFNIAFVSEQEGTNGSLSHVSTFSLVIDYTVPVVNYNITVQNDLPNNGGIIEVDYASLSSPVARTWGPTPNHQAKAIDQDYLNYFRVFRDRWNKAGSQYATTREISITPDASVTYEAKFRRRFDVGITVASYIEPGSGGTYKVNGTNIGSTWQGTFLEFDPTPILLEAVPPSGDWFFVQWSDGNRQNPRNLTPIDHITDLHATFKFHIGSSISTATGSNSQRVVSTIGDKYHMAYESGGAIWYTSSADGGTTWRNEERISSGSSSAPSVALWAENGPRALLFTVYHNDVSNQIMFADARNPSPEPISASQSTAVGARPVIAWFDDNGNSSLLALWQGPDGLWYNFGYYNSGSQWFGEALTEPGNFGNPSIAACDVTSVYPEFFVTYDNGSSIFAFDYPMRLHEAVPASVGPLSYASQVCGTNTSSPEAHVVWEAYGGEEPSTDRGESWKGSSIQWQRRVMYQCWEGSQGENGYWFPADEFRSANGSVNFHHPTIINLSNGNLVWAWDDGSSTYKAVYDGSWNVTEVYNGMSYPNLASPSSNGPIDAVRFVGTGTTGAPYPLALGIQTSRPGDGAPASVLPEQYSRRVVVARRPSHQVRGLRRSHPMESGSTDEGDSDPDSSAFFSVEVTSISLKMHDGSIVPVDFSPPDSASNEQTVWSSLTSIPITLASNIDSIIVDGESETEGLSRLGSSEIGLSYNIVDADRGTLLRRLNTERVYRTSGVRPLGFRDQLAGLTGGRVVLRPSVRGFNSKVNKLVSTVVHVHTLLDGSVKARGSMLAKKGLGPTLSLPTSFALHQNYPNPFNPTTEIRFNLPDAGNVSLVVYDVLGREVANLANGYREAGYHSATWNATNQASGVYFARFSVTNAEGKVAYSKVNKLVMMK